MTLFKLSNFNNCKNYVNNAAELEKKQAKKLRELSLQLETQRTDGWNGEVSIEVKKAQINKLYAENITEIVNQQNTIIELIDSVINAISSAEQQVVALLQALELEKLGTTANFSDLDMTSNSTMTLDELKEKDINLYNAVNYGGKSMNWAELAYLMKQGKLSVEEIKALATKYGVDERDLYYSLDEYALAQKYGVSVEDFRKMYKGLNDTNNPYFQKFYQAIQEAGYADKEALYDSNLDGARGKVIKITPEQWENVRADVLEALDKIYRKGGGATPGQSGGTDCCGLVSLAINSAIDNILGENNTYFYQSPGGFRVPNAYGVQLDIDFKTADEEVYNGIPVGTIISWDGHVGIVTKPGYISEQYNTGCRGEEFKMIDRLPFFTPDRAYSLFDVSY